MKKLSISTTDRTNFKRCRQQWEFSSSLRLYLEPDRPQEPLWFGSMMHKALASYYNPQYPTREVKRALDTYNHEVEESFAEYKERFGLWEEEKAAFEIQRDLGVDMLTHYCTSFAPKMDDFEVKLVEDLYDITLGYWCECHGFQTEVHRCGAIVEVIYTFVVDALVERANGKFWILEHKNMAKFSDNRRWLSMDDQVGSYIVCVQERHQLQVAGVLYNTLIKRERKPLKQNKNGAFSVDKRQSVPYEEAKRAIEESGQETGQYQEFLDFLQQRDELENPWFRREPIRRNQNEVKLTYASMVTEAKMMINPDVEITRTPSQFNCGGCAFFDPCIRKWEGGDYQFLLDSMYRRKNYRGDIGSVHTSIQ